jgi:GAF domain-containing protein
VPDIRVPGAYESRLRENLIKSGVRAVLAVPMLSEGRLVGCLVVSRNQPGEFPAETIDLLRTFAPQSALAIQNARLFELDLSGIEAGRMELASAPFHLPSALDNAVTLVKERNGSGKGSAGLTLAKKFVELHGRSKAPGPHGRRPQTMNRMSEPYVGYA